MKIIQTYWSKPLSENRVNGGWFSMKYHYLSWAFSSLKCKQYYNDVELYTDLQGKELLIDRLQLPYSKVHVCLDDIRDLPSQIWAMSKIYTYGLQNQPFIHIDGDVYIWSKFSKELESAPLISQNIERYNSYYKSSLRYMSKKNFSLPQILENINLIDNQECAVNAGILGGNDIEFFKDFSNTAFEFLHSNIEKLSNPESEKLNVIIEQFLFYQLVKKQEKEIKFLLNNVKEDFSDLKEFALIPKYKNYIHLIGTNKQSEFACNMIEHYLQLEFPVYYNFFKNTFVDSNFEQNFYISKIRQNSNSTFDYTFCYASKFYTSFIVNTVETINIQQRKLDKLQLDVTVENQEFIRELFQFVGIQSSLLDEGVKITNDFLSFDYFRKIKKLLDSHSKEQILKMKYKLSDSVRIGVFNYNFQIILSKKNFSKIDIEKIEKEKCFFTFIKTSKSTVKYYRLNDFDNLLYYLSHGEMTGYDLIELLLNHKTISENTKLNLRDDVYKFIADNLLCTSFIVVDEQ